MRALGHLGWRKNRGGRARRHSFYSSGFGSPPYFVALRQLKSDMDTANRSQLQFSPYRTFDRGQWAKLRADTPMTLVERDLDQARGLIGELSLEEVEQIYLPLSRLVNLYVAASQELHLVTNRFLGRKDLRVPFVIGIAGSVAVGKSTSARVLQALLARWADHPKVDLVTTDGFLLSNAVLEERGLMTRKGFPESFDISRLLNFMNDVKAGKENVSAPVYSHFHYDIVPGQEITISRPDILIVEGLNLLQPARLPKDGEAVPFVSDFLDFSIYIDADEAVIQRWYLSRFMKLRQTAFRDPAAYFHRYAGLDHAQAEGRALEIWRTINLKNLHENILPTRQRAGLIIRKNEAHRTEAVSLRRI